MKTMVCTGCSGNWACTVELGSDDLEPNRCIHDPKEDPYAEWLDTTGKTKVKLAIADAAMEMFRVIKNFNKFTGVSRQYSHICCAYLDTRNKLLDLCKKLEATS